jgi:hypothetical protein
MFEAMQDLLVGLLVVGGPVWLFDASLISVTYCNIPCER